MCCSEWDLCLQNTRKKGVHNPNQVESRAANLPIGLSSSLADYFLPGSDTDV